MSQKITIQIAGREYPMNAPTPKDEEDIRLAANIINRKISGFLAKYPGRNMADILAFVALNESISSISLQRRLNSIQDETEQLQSDMINYIENTEK